jgi:two-component system sensor histidine kinase/response regulator
MKTSAIIKNNVKLLLVEDDEDDYVLTLGLLDDIIAEEYVLTWASTPDEARYHFSRDQHDLCLMDYRLGSEDGLLLLREAPLLGFQGPIIMLTGQDNKQLDREALNAGAEDYLVKSQLNAAGLARTIRYALTRRDMERERLERLRAEAENRAKSEFLAHLSHELRTPLTAILGYTDLLLSSQEPLERNHLHIIKRNGRHLLSLLNDVLDLSKIEAGKLEVEHLDVHLHSFIREIGSLIQVNAQDKNLQLSISASTPLPEKIKTDPTRLRQILLNLLGNAIKFTDAGEIYLEIAETSHEGKSYLEFSVQDTGIGIAEEDIEKLFKPFSQAGHLIGLREQGTGLGLVISRQLAQYLGGNIRVQSRLGNGSKFTVYIDPGPLDDVERYALDVEAQIDNSTNAQSLSLSGHILITDDLPDIRFLIGHLISSFGGTVSYAANGEEAITLVNEKAAQNEPFDLLIMDSQMPVMDGLTATRLLREQGFTNPILALTAATLRGEREQCLAAGCDDYLGKPIETTTLLNRVQKLLTRTKQQSAVTAHQILLVEDNQDAREVTALLLSHLGWKVLTASCGQEALALVDKMNPAVVLLDLNLPDMDGYQLAKRLREAGLQESRFIILSGQLPDPTRSEDTLIDHHLMKPLQVAELADILNRL